MSLVRLENVSKHYTLGEQQVQALKDVSLCIHDGEFLAIAGPSGSGKSTLLNLIGCIDTPSLGRFSSTGRTSAAAHQMSFPISGLGLLVLFFKRSICFRFFPPRKMSNTPCYSSRN